MRPFYELLAGFEFEPTVELFRKKHGDALSKLKLTYEQENHLKIWETWDIIEGAIHYYLTTFHQFYTPENNGLITALIRTYLHDNRALLRPMDSTVKDFIQYNYNSLAHIYTRFRDKYQFARSRWLDTLFQSAVLDYMKAERMIVKESG